MHCPFCDADKESLKVIDSRTCEGGRSIRRRRECLKCEKRFTTYERIEDPIKLIGELVTDRLRRVDQIAYVRFASVYREFKTLPELVEEAKAVIDARRFED